MIQHIGKVAEYFVLAELIRRGAEAYSAISFRQPNYDITVIRPDATVSRVQVKATELHNKSTNNPARNLAKDYDHLVLVVFDAGEPAYFVLTKREAEVESAPNRPGTIYVSKRVRGRYEVKKTINEHKDRWDKIIGTDGERSNSASAA